jgi:short-subunit dehydrogenase
LTGRRVLVTGASSGIGAEVAKLLAAKGVTVVAVGRDEGELVDLRSARGRIELVQADLRTRDGQSKVVERAGTIHGFVNDAGVGWVGLVEDMPPDEIDRIVSVNVLAVLRLTRCLLPLLVRRGHVVNIGSVLGLAASPPLTVYSATKFAVHGFSQALRQELAGRAYVTEITPGPVNTRFFSRATSRPEAARVPSFPMVDPARVGKAVVRAMERPGWPGYRTVGVPRGSALAAKVTSLPGPNAARVAASRVARSRLVLRPGDPAKG